MFDEIKIIVFLIMSTITFLGSFAGMVAGALLIKFKVSTLVAGQEKILGIMYDDSGALRFQTRDDCVSCRKSCRDEICVFVAKEMAASKEAIARLESSIKRLHERMDKQ